MDTQLSSLDQAHVHPPPRRYLPV